MDLPVFPLHTVLFPGATLAIRVFEERYLAMMEAVVPDGTFVVAAIRSGREVAGPADPYRVGVTTAIEEWSYAADGTAALRVTGVERVRLVAARPSTDHPVWHVEPFPDEGPETADLERALAAYRRFLAVTLGSGVPLERLPSDETAASYALAEALPALVPQRQRLLEAPGPRERLDLLRRAFSLEARLIGRLGAGVAGADPAIHPN